jgi:hypothetical protein
MPALTDWRTVERTTSLLQSDCWRRLPCSAESSLVPGYDWKRTDIIAFDSINNYILTLAQNFRPGLHDMGRMRSTGALCVALDHFLAAIFLYYFSLNYSKI